MISLRFLQGKEKRPVIVVQLEGASVLAMVVPVVGEEEEAVVMVLVIGNCSRGGGRF